MKKAERERETKRGKKEKAIAMKSSDFYDFSSSSNSDSKVYIRFLILVFTTMKCPNLKSVNDNY